MTIADYATYRRAAGDAPPTRLPPPVEAKDTAVLTREFIFRAVSVVFEVAPERLEQRGRGKARTALARQVAMYLAHVGCQLSLTAVGELFGRDRTTVAHACKRVEDGREALPFDHAVGVLERSVRAIVKTSPALRRDLELIEGGLVRTRDEIGGDA